MAKRYKLKVQNKLKVQKILNGESLHPLLLEHLDDDPIIKKALILKYVQEGLLIEDACKLIGVTKYELGTFRSDPEFDNSIIKSQVICEQKNLKNVSDAGDAGMWQASGWILERLRPDRYVKKDIVKHEYDIKLNTFVQLVLNVINDTAPHLRKTIAQKLRNANVLQTVYDAQTVEMEKQKDTYIKK